MTGKTPTGKTPTGKTPAGKTPTGTPSTEAAGRPVLVVDARGRRCPIPIIELARQIGDVDVDQIVELLADDPAAAADVTAWCRMRGHALITAPRTTTEARTAGDGDSYLVRRLH